MQLYQSRKLFFQRMIPKLSQLTVISPISVTNVSPTSFLVLMPLANNFDPYWGSKFSKTCHASFASDEIISSLSNSSLQSAPRLFQTFHAGSKVAGLYYWAFLLTPESNDLDILKKVPNSIQNIAGLLRLHVTT